MVLVKKTPPSNADSEQRFAKLEKQNRIFKISISGLSLIVIVILIISLARPTESATTPGTCLPTAKGGTGCFDEEFFNRVYPIGSIYTSTDSTDPGDKFGGVWEQIEGMMLIGSSDIFPAGTTGGEQEHTLTVNEMPVHRHATNYRQHAAGFGDWAPAIADGTGTAVNNYDAFNHNSGGGQPHNNMPPYLAVYMWKRVS